MQKQFNVMEREEYRHNFAAQSNHLFHHIHYIKMFNRFNFKVQIYIKMIAVIAILMMMISHQLRWQTALQIQKLIRENQNRVR